MDFNSINQFIRGIELRRDKIDSFSKYPFCIPVIKNLNYLNLHPNVTFIVGENGSGKSTILESIAVAYGFNPEGGTKNFNFSSVDTHSSLHNYIKIIKGVRKPKDGFFLRAESFYNIESTIDELNFDGSPSFIQGYGGKSLYERSHGEAFLALILNRFNGNSVFILDEPEAALSPLRQMTLISRIHQLALKGSQFIIATHSPIIMAYPNASIYEIREGNLQLVNYKDTESYKITSSFINNTNNMLDILLNNKE